MKIRKSNKALTDLVGTFILLSIAIALFSVVNIVVFTYPFNPPTPSANLVGLIDETDNIIIKHNYGDRLDLETIIIVTIGTFRYEEFANVGVSDSSGDGYWSIGESFIVDPDALWGNSIDVDESVDVTVVDPGSESVLMMADLQKSTP